MTLSKSKEWYKKAYLITFITAWILCTIPTIITGFLKLPKIVVENEADQTLSGAFIFVIICAAYPLFKGLLKYMKSPSAWLILWILTAFLGLLVTVPKETLNAVFIVTFVASIGNSLGAILFFASRQFKEKWKFCGEVKINGTH